MDEAAECHPLERALDYRFERRERLETALRHRSAEGDDNERLEFLGDAVLDLAIREFLLNEFPDASEGELARWRSFLASKLALNRIAADLDIAELIAHDLGEAADNAGRRERIIADAVEATFGAVFADSDYETAAAVIRRQLEPLIHEMADDPFLGDHKSALQSWYQKKTGDTPTYEVLRRDGPNHSPQFEVAVRLGAEQGEAGVGRSKREAAQHAARKTLLRKNVIDTTNTASKHDDGE